MYVEGIPIEKASPEEKRKIGNLVRQILANSESPSVPVLEKEIEQLVYSVYKLKPQEISLVEGSSIEKGSL